MREPLVRPALPDAVRAVVRTLASTGRATFVTGECLADLLAGRERTHFTLATRATPGEIAGLFARAVPTAPRGAAWQVPTAAGPADVLPMAEGTDVADALADRGLTVLAMAWSPLDDDLLDPYGGVEDLAGGRLRAVGEAPARLRARPDLVFHVARLGGRHGLWPDAPLEAAMAALERADLERCPAPTRSRLLRETLVGPHAGEAVALLARTGIAARLGAGVLADCPALLAEAPPDVGVRLAVWLRGGRAGRFVRRHRIPPEQGERVLDLLAAHPVERRFDGHRRASLARLGRLPETDRRALFWLRRRELELRLDAQHDARPGSGGAAGSDGPDPAAARRALDALAEALEAHLEREAALRAAPALALDGRDVMRILSIDPGPEVGEALALLRASVAADPDLNRPDTLRTLLEEWSRGRGPGRAPRSEGTEDGPG